MRAKLKRAGIDMDELTCGFMAEQEYFKDILIRTLEYLSPRDDPIKKRRVIASLEVQRRSKLG